MQQWFLNAMAIVQRFGKPDYFITMTCNPYWELQDMLELEIIGDDYIQLPNDIVNGYTDTEMAVNKLIQDVFPSLEEHATSATYMSSRAILLTKNKHVDELNAMMIERFPGEEKVYHSLDTVVDYPQNHFPIDFLNSITPNGLPRV
jgi:ATP-dependent DNA helicase PIF1